MACHSASQAARNSAPSAKPLSCTKVASLQAQWPAQLGTVGGQRAGGWRGVQVVRLVETSPLLKWQQHACNTRAARPPEATQQHDTPASSGGTASRLARGCAPHRSASGRAISTSCLYCQRFMGQPWGCMEPGTGRTCTSTAHTSGPGPGLLALQRQSATVRRKQRLHRPSPRPGPGPPPCRRLGPPAVRLTARPCAACAELASCCAQ